MQRRHEFATIIYTCYVVWKIPTYEVHSARRLVTAWAQLYKGFPWFVGCVWPIRFDFTTVSKGDSGQSGLTLQLFPKVILVNQVWSYNCFQWKQLYHQTWLARITFGTNENALYNWVLDVLPHIRICRKQFSMVLYNLKQSMNIYKYMTNADMRNLMTSHKRDAQCRLGR